MTEYLRYTESGWKEHISEDDVIFWSSHFNEQIRRRINIWEIPCDLWDIFFHIDDIISSHDTDTKHHIAIKHRIH